MKRNQKRGMAPDPLRFTMFRRVDLALASHASLPLHPCACSRYCVFSPASLLCSLRWRNGFRSSCIFNQKNVKVIHFFATPRPRPKSLSGDISTITWVQIILLVRYAESIARYLAYRMRACNQHYFLPDYPNFSISCSDVSRWWYTSGRVKGCESFLCKLELLSTRKDWGYAWRIRQEVNADFRRSYRQYTTKVRPRHPSSSAWV